MSGYMLSPTESGLPSVPMVVVEAAFEGYRLRIARRPGSRAFLFADDVADGIGSDMNANMRGLHERFTVIDSVVIGSQPRAVRLIAARDFFYLCQLNPSPRLDNFRNRVADIVEEIQETGHYNSNPGSAVSHPGPIIPDQDSDPFLAGLARIGQAYLLAKAAKDEASSARQAALEAKSDVNAVRDQLGQGPAHWTVAAWCVDHGVKITKEVARREGGRLHHICKRMGYVVPEKKVCMGSEFPSTRWPLKAIEEWWPDFKRRNGIV